MTKSLNYLPAKPQADIDWDSPERSGYNCSGAILDRFASMDGPIRVMRLRNCENRQVRPWIVNSAWHAELGAMFRDSFAQGLVDIAAQGIPVDVKAMESPCITQVLNPVEHRRMNDVLVIPSIAWNIVHTGSLEPGTLLSVGGNRHAVWHDYAAEDFRIRREVFSATGAHRETKVIDLF